MLTPEQKRLVRDARRRRGRWNGSDEHIMNYAGDNVIGSQGAGLHRARACAYAAGWSSTKIGELNARLSGNTFKTVRAPR